jgi:RimJ/RimL family protein N-acetyltransferase
MDSCLAIRETKNIDDIMSILNHEKIYEVITDDNGSVEFDVNDYKFIIGYLNSKPVALMIYHFDNDWFCHIQILPEYREYADSFARQALRWFWNNHESDCIMADIPDKYQNVIRFAKKHGFSHEKELADLYIKDGVYYNENRYKLERHKWDSLGT